MLETILRLSIQNRLFVVLLTAFVGILGLRSFQQLPIDAVPDITNVQVQINTPVEALSPLEVERQITFPIEWAMGGIPAVESVRSLSRYGLSQVTVIFEDGTNIYWARQLVNEKLQGARSQLPPGSGEPEMGPVATGLGEIFMWSLENAPGGEGPRRSITELRGLQDWVVRPQFRTVRGVNEVNSIGGHEKVYQVAPDPAKLIAHGLSFRDLHDALAANNSNAGGGYIVHENEQYTIRSVGRVQSLADIENIVVSAREGVPIYVKTLARVYEGRDLRTGAATVGGEEAVIGTTIMLVGENSRVVSRRASEKVAEVSKSLPQGVRMNVLYDRTYLVDATLRTVRNNLFEGAVLVIVILFMMLGNIRAALVTAMAIPLSMLIAVTGMVRYEISGNLMSLGAIDFGLIVDGAVIIVENCIRLLAEKQHALGRLLSPEERSRVIQEASLEVLRPSVFGGAIIMIVYLPILTLSGIEGKMFGPMAYTVLFALLGATVLSLTFVPALCTYALSGPISEEELFAVRWAKRVYQPVLDRAIRSPFLVVLGCVLLVVASGLVATRMGSEFVPKLGEGALAVQASRLPSVSLDTSVDLQKKTEALIQSKFPDEVDLVFARTGTAEVATDPMGPNVSDTYLMLSPRDEWTKVSTQDELASAISHELEENIPGQTFEISQPIELRFNELISGVRSDVAVKVFGDDTKVMLAYAEKIATVMRKVPGAADVKVEQVSGLPVLNIQIQREVIARYGIRVDDVQEVIETALGGKEAGEVFEGDRRYALLVRLADRRRGDLDEIRRLPIPLPEEAAADEAGRAAHGSAPGGHLRYLPLSAVATIDLAEGPNQISRENGKRRIVVQANVRGGRDIGSFVAELQERIDQEIGRPPEGCWLGWGGQFENLIAAKERLTLVVPVALTFIFILLYLSLESMKLTVLVFTGVPLALTGGIFALWLRDMPFSIPAGIGFIALSGVAVLNGLVMVSFIAHRHDEGHALETAVREGSMLRLRPVLMTALVASLGFIPMALATSSGAEVQRPLATVVIGGLITSTLLTLIVVPAVFRFFASSHPRRRIVDNPVSHSPEAPPEPEIPPPVDPGIPREPGQPGDGPPGPERKE